MRFFVDNSGGPKTAIRIKILQFCIMLQVTAFVFNPFAENTYIVSNERNSCIIFDPGMYNATEQMALSEHIKKMGLKPKYLINTHCHIDHIMGNTYISETYSLPLKAHKLEKQILELGTQSAMLYGLDYHPSVPISEFIDENDVFRLEDDELKIFFTPGHSPGSLSFYSSENKFLISGDVLFKNSIGRTDLPGGDYDTLISSIKKELMGLPDETVVYSGHGPATRIGDERMFNPFLNA